MLDAYQYRAPLTGAVAIAFRLLEQRRLPSLALLGQAIAERRTAEPAYADRALGITPTLH